MSYRFSFVPLLFLIIALPLASTLVYVLYLTAVRESPFLTLTVTVTVATLTWIALHRQ